MATPAHEKKVAGMRRNLKAKTGRDLDEWVALLRQDGPAEPKAQLAWLKDVHGLGHFQAKLVVGAQE